MPKSLLQMTRTAIITELRGDNESGLWGKVVACNGPYTISELKSNGESNNYEVGDWVKAELLERNNHFDVLAIHRFAWSHWVPQVVVTPNGGKELTLKGTINIKKGGDVFETKSYFSAPEVGTVPIDNDKLKKHEKCTHLDVELELKKSTKHPKRIYINWEVKECFGGKTIDDSNDDSVKKEYDETKEHLAIVVKYLDGPEILVWVRELKVAAVLYRGQFQEKKIKLGSMFMCTLYSPKTEFFNISNGVYFEVKKIVAVLDLEVATRVVDDEEIELLLSVDVENITTMGDTQVSYSNAKELICLTQNSLFNQQHGNEKKEMWCKLAPQKLTRDHTADEILKLYTRQTYNSQTWTTSEMTDESMDKTDKNGFRENQQCD